METTRLVSVLGPELRMFYFLIVAQLQGVFSVFV